MAKINVLPSHIAQLIAAGEVVERPASVVKELVENAIDAKANTITVEIKNGGISYIRITDNGIGIEREDVRNAFVNHATSKISIADDLDAIFTLGFRGEALASIAAVSKTEILTKPENHEMGTRFECHAGEEVSFDNAGCPNGTTIVIRDLFYNTPARMKFLKRDVSEANAVADVIDKLALSHPEISFRFIREGKQVLLTAGDSKLSSAIYSVFSSEFSKNLLEVDYTFNAIKITGYISSPISCRGSRSMQYFYLNNRYIKSQSCCMSMENAYKGMAMVGKFPICVLNIEVAPNTVDVNVHPAKTQVRFSDEKRVSSAVYYAVKTALEQKDVPKQVDLGNIQKLTEKAQAQAVQLEMVNAPSTNVTVQTPKQTQSFKATPNEDFWQHKPVKQPINNPTKVAASRSLPTNKFEDEVDLINLSKPKQKEKEIIQTQSVEVVQEVPKEPISEIIIKEKTEEPKLKIIGEAFKTYIICEYENKLIMIDKHAAHERIIYNKLKKQAENSISSQILLVPVTLTLNKLEYNTVIENIDVFEKSGFGIDDFGDGAIIVREIPTLLYADDVESMVNEIAVYLSENRSVIENEKVDNIYHTSACKAAIKAGNNNSIEELMYLAKQVLTDDNVRYCPHGRPVMIELTRYELEKQFGRIQ